MEADHITSTYIPLANAYFKHPTYLQGKLINMVKPYAPQEERLSAPGIS